MKTTFQSLSIGDQFYCNGNLCTKKSSRTAYIDGELQARWFYFGLNEYVTKVKQA